MKGNEDMVSVKLRETTGKSFGEYVELVERSGIEDYLERINLLKSVYKLGQLQAKIVVASFYYHNNFTIYKESLEIERYFRKYPDHREWFHYLCEQLYYVAKGLTVSFNHDHIDIRKHTGENGRAPVFLMLRSTDDGLLINFSTSINYGNPTLDRVNKRITSDRKIYSVYLTSVFDVTDSFMNILCLAYENVVVGKR